MGELIVLAWALQITRQLANELKPLLSVNGAIFSSGKQILATRATGILVTHFAAIEELVKVRRMLSPKYTK